MSWLGVLGVDLQLPADAGGGSTLRGRSRRVWAGILFGFFAGSRLYLLVTDELRVVQDEGEAPVEQYSLTATWTRHLRHTTAALAPILVFASFLAAVALRWRQLSHCLAATLHQMDLNDQFYRRLRRISVAGLLCILMVTSLISLASLDSFELITDAFAAGWQEILVEIYEHFTDPNTKKMNRFARRALNWASDVYRFSPVVLFGCLVSTASMTLDAIIADVDRHQRSRRVEARLLHWRHQLGHIHDLIGAVNAFFGKAMLFFFVQLFISFVVYLFRIISEVRKDPTSPSNGVAVLRILKDVFWFIIVTAVSEQIPQRVSCIRHFVDSCYGSLGSFRSKR